MITDKVKTAKPKKEKPIGKPSEVSLIIALPAPKKDGKKNGKKSC